MKWLYNVVGCLAAFILLNLILDELYPAGLDTMSTRRADALLFDRPGYSADLPDKAEITVDGIHAVFHRGDNTYVHLVTFLHNEHSQGIVVQGPTGLPPGNPCGELVIRSYGITSRFQIERDRLNKDVYYIWLPHLNRGGYAIPILTADPRVIDFIKTSGSDSK